MIFSSLDLSPDIQKALDACGYHQMTPIQEKAIIPARRGKDLLANAQTGTGKTAAFAIPILQQIVDDKSDKKTTHPCALILTPTRELAEQLARTINGYAQFLPLNINAFFGGVKMGSQENKLKNGVDILISTPGRLLEHLVQGNVNLSEIKFVVLDEADRMLDMGFISDVHSILNKTPKKRQTLLFSATISQSVRELASKLLHNHKIISVDKQNAVAKTVEHVVYPVEERRKAELFIQLLNKNNWFKVLVFSSTKDQANKLMLKLNQAKIKASICHGDKTQGSRRRALADFMSDKIQVLVATEVAARGLHIDALEHVVNFNLPYLAEDYIHRVGRTGRAGMQGQAISFVSREEERALANIERLIGHQIKRINLPGYEVTNREPLLKNIKRHRRPVRSNKTSHTRIDRRESTKNKRKTKN